MMKNKRLQAMISMILAVCLCFGTFGVANAAFIDKDSGETYVQTKLSHPDNGTKTPDGLVDYMGGGLVSPKDQGQGDRGQSYSWAAVGNGDWVYVATCYNAMGNTLTLMDSALGNDFDPDVMKATLNVLFNGTFFTGEEDGVNVGGILVKVNAKTGETKLLMSKATTGQNCLFRNACTYKDKLYFCGSVNGLPCIYQIDPQTDACKMVYQGMTLQDYMQGFVAGICTGIRGMCEYDGELIVSCVTKEGPQILSSATPWEGQKAFRQIAGQAELFDYPAYHYCDSIYGGSIWEMVNFNGHLYVSICTGTPENMPDEHTMQSFALVRGDKDTKGNWTWTPVIGDTADGAKYTFGIDPERTRAGAGVLQVYGDYLYIGEYNDVEIALEDVLFNLDFTFLNRNLEQSVSLYRMDPEENIELVMGDATQMFPEGGISSISSGFGRNENQYIWRMTEYAGKLYIGTFDNSSLLEPIGQFANGDLLKMSQQEWRQLIGFIRTLLELKKGGNAKTNSQSSSRLDGLNILFEENTDQELAEEMTGGVSTYALDPSIAELYRIAGQILNCASYLRTASRGFDLYVTEDGSHFQTITTNGFGDPYNHGLRVFAETDNGLTVGTANPFYGTQLWQLEEITARVDRFESNLDIHFDRDTTSYQVSAPYGTKAFTFTMTPADPNCTIVLNGNALDGFSGVVPLQADKTVVTIASRTADGSREIVYSFTITMAPCDGGNTCYSAKFSDLDHQMWYHPYTDYVIERQLMVGYDDNLFHPNSSMTRAMLTTVLYRMAGSPEVQNPAPFTDVAPASYYADAVAWAFQSGITNGVSATKFAPNQPVTREQAAAFMYRFAKEFLKQSDMPQGNLQHFTDAGTISNYAKEPMAWAYAVNLIEGYGNGLVGPKDACTRCQMAKLLTLLEKLDSNA